MEFIGLVLPKDDKEIYRKVSDAAKAGDVESPAQHAQVKLFATDDPLADISKEGVSKLANKLRNGLREFGRFNVKVEGNIAEISVSSRAVRAPKKKVVTLPDAPKVPAAKKAAKA